MPFKIIRNDITKVHADAIVNTANPEPVFDRGTDQILDYMIGQAKACPILIRRGHERQMDHDVRR